MEGEIRKKVSCHVITYNHVNYIQKCIDGILMQKTNFDFEIIIGDDVSTDGTREIIQEYATKYPELIKLNLRQKRGIGIPGKENFVSTMEMCTGEYISLCDGDDYWTDPRKLQKQVDFLEKRKDYILCFHKIKILTPEGNFVDDFITKIPKNHELRKTLIENSNYIHTPSIVFRNINFIEFQGIEFQNSPIGDYFLYLILTNYGKIGFIDETMGVYRHGVGVYSSLDRMKMIKADLQLFINLYSFEKDIEFKKIFYRNILNIIESIQKINDNLAYENKLLTTRRHRFIEKLYRFIRR
ncbi:glycosyltransferase [uncultured Chryseobacterium sp.]|uniref:glycosyltransferase n=1 Tax=uncultured Chryseobacterium sp. TaxID=259322 RepID=UPI0025F149C8|nr:glycosyltransferase [uncultured Chryseobacterium sp.]